MNGPESRPTGSGTGTSGGSSSGARSDADPRPVPPTQNRVGAEATDNSASGGSSPNTGTAPAASTGSSSAPAARPAPAAGASRGPGSPRPASGPRPGGPPGRGGRFPPRPTDSRRINHQIRIRQIRVIDEEGKQLGVLETADALALALHKGLDLVEIAPEQRPPVCRIMDYGKFKYEEKKKQQASKRKQHQVQIKELRVRPKIAEHDVQVKVGKARQFIEDGDKVMIVCLFRGREMAHKEVGDQVIRNVFDRMKDVAKVESPTRMEGRRMVMLISKK